jgi:hypothetical protein
MFSEFDLSRAVALITADFALEEGRSARLSGEITHAPNGDTR